MTVPVTHITQAEIQELDRLYRSDNRADVLAFIEQYPVLLPVLLDAPAKIAAFFPDATLTLEVALDPEEEIADALALTIVTPIERAKARELDRQFYRASGHDLNRRANWKLIIFVYSSIALEAI